MKSFFLSAVILIFISITTAKAQTSSWVNLFDGTTLTGWKQVAGKAHFDVFRGTIVGTAVPNSPNSFLGNRKRIWRFRIGDGSLL